MTRHADEQISSGLAVVVAAAAAVLKPGGPGIPPPPRGCGLPAASTHTAKHCHAAPPS